MYLTSLYKIFRIYCPRPLPHFSPYQPMSLLGTEMHHFLLKRTTHIEWFLYKILSPFSYLDAMFLMCHTYIGIKTWENFLEPKSDFGPITCYRKVVDAEEFMHKDPAKNLS